MREIPPPAVFFEDRKNPLTGGKLFTDPVSQIVADTPEALPACWDALEVGLAKGLHAAGFCSYELGYCLDASLRPFLPEDRRTPLLWFGLFGPPAHFSARELDRYFAGLAPPRPLADCEATIDERRYRDQAGQVLDLIRAGDVYQVNLTFALRFTCRDDPLNLYAALRARQPVAHGGIVLLEDRSILSVSPEQFIAAHRDHIETRPMKGTIPRGTDPASDRRQAALLVSSEKERAENLMIVDLLRNDLARVTQPGSVAVPDLFTLETYPALHTLTSTIHAELKPGLKAREIFEAMFPCGSIVGAPKHRATRIIRALEGGPRGIYTGSVGEISPDRRYHFNVAIRTVELGRDGQGRYGVGSGVVADSEPDGEWRECLLKGKVLTDLSEDFDLLETFGWYPEEGFRFLPLHFERLEDSARLLGFTFERARIQADLDVLATTLLQPTRCRLSLNRQGGHTVTSTTLDPDPERPLRVTLARTRLDAGDPYLRHKTSWRAIHEAAFAEAARHEADEALFLNQYDEVAEASRNAIFVAGPDRSLLTPPLGCGVLPGVLRRHLIETGRAHEAPCTLDMLRQGTWYLGNSLRGLRPAILIPVPGEIANPGEK